MMKSYTYTVELVHDVRVHEYLTVTVEAGDEDLAEGMAKQRALNKVGEKSPCEGEILDTDVGDIWLENCSMAPPATSDLTGFPLPRGGEGKGEGTT